MQKMKQNYAKRFVMHEGEKRKKGEHTVMCSPFS